MMSRYLVVLHICLVLVACGGGGGSGDNNGSDSNGGDGNNPSPTPTPGPTDEVNCDTPLVFFVQNANMNHPDYVPSWEQLDCYVEDMQRLSQPSFAIQVSDTPPVEGGEHESRTFWENHQLIMNDFVNDWPQAHLHGINLGEVPPYLVNGADSYTEQEWDEKLRGMAMYGMYLKSLGQRIEVNFFYPPSLFGESDNIPATNSAEEFLDWWNEHYIPERVELAEVAELIKAEYYQPWDVEPGQFVRSLGDNWLDQLTEEEQIQVTQTAIDNLYEAIRPVYSGILVLINYDRYEAVGDHWKNLNLSDWDEVQFILFTEGNLAWAESYIQNQINANVEMVERDNLGGRIYFDVAVNRFRHERLFSEGDPSYDEIEDDIYQAFFDAVDALEIDVNGIGLEAGSIETEAARTLVTDKLNSYSIQ